MKSVSLLDRFSALEDPRQSWKTVCPLPEILLLVLCGVMAGADDFVEIARWGNRLGQSQDRLSAPPSAV